MTVSKKNILYFLVFTALFFSCSPSREVTTPADPAPVKISAAEAMLAEALTSMHAGETHFEHFGTRFSGHATFMGDQYSISGNIRMRRDSAIYISVSPMLGIEMLRAMITPDTVKVINRLEGTYYQGGMEIIGNMMGANLDYQMLESILLGNDFQHFTADNFHLIADDNRILLQNRQRHPMEGPNRDWWFDQNLWLDKQTHRIRENLMYEPERGRSIRARYGDFSQVDGQTIPQSLSITFIEQGNRAELSIRYSRTTIDQPQNMSFSIPDRYLQVNP